MDDSIIQDLRDVYILTNTSRMVTASNNFSVQRILEATPFHVIYYVYNESIISCDVR